MISDNNSRRKRLGSHVIRPQIIRHFQAISPLFAIFILLLVATLPANAREKDVLEYGAGLIVNIPHPEPEVARVVEDVAQNTIIRGTKEYNKDEFVSGAAVASATPAFAAWTEGGKVFYKVRTNALDPRNFKAGGDVGTLAVRYVVQPQGDQNTVLRIDAVFVEDFRHASHPSNGSVESSEYKDIQDRLDAVELMKKETAEAERAKQEHAAKQKFGMGNGDANGNDTVQLSTPAAALATSTATSSSREDTAYVPTSAPPGNTTAFAIPQSSNSSAGSSEPLQQHVAELRKQVERLVKKPGAPLKAAPFHSANTLKSLDPGVDVLIVISTPYWYGVETRDGQHGWILREQLEQLP